MSYGTVSYGTVTTSDIVAPGAPTFISIQQISNQTVSVVLAIPAIDSDGSNLTGLTKITIVTVAMSGEHPFEGKSMSEVLAVPGVVSIDVSLQESDAGTQKTVEMPVVNLGGQQAFAAACAD